MSEERKFEIVLTAEGALLILPCVNQRELVIKDSPAKAVSLLAY
ncbi:hypothetical protein ABLB69_06150 [Xenorhabdus khoisanae]